MSDLIKNINTAEFEELKSQKGLYLIDFWAEWCPPCKAMAPILEQIAPTIPRVNFIKIDIDENQQLSGELGVTSIPTFFLINMPGDGTFDPNKDIARKFVGAVPALDFKMAIESAVEQIPEDSGDGTAKSEASSEE